MSNWMRYKNARAKTHFMRKSPLANYYQPLCKESDDSHWYAPSVLERTNDNRCKRCDSLLAAIMNSVPRPERMEESR
jgi:hypothetical protein